MHGIYNKVILMKHKCNTRHALSTIFSGKQLRFPHHYNILEFDTIPGTKEIQCEVSSLNGFPSH